MSKFIVFLFTAFMILTFSACVERVEVCEGDPVLVDESFGDGTGVDPSKVKFIAPKPKIQTITKCDNERMDSTIKLCLYKNSMEYCAKHAVSTYCQTYEVSTPFVESFLKNKESNVVEETDSKDFKEEAKTTEKTNPLKEVYEKLQLLKDNTDSKKESEGVEKSITILEEYM